MVSCKVRKNVTLRRKKRKNVYIILENILRVKRLYAILHLSKQISILKCAHDAAQRHLHGQAVLPRIHICLAGLSSGKKLIGTEFLFFGPDRQILKEIV